MPESLTVLGIESSCDETAVAILRSAGEEKAPEILSSITVSYTHLTLPTKLEV